MRKHVLILMLILLAFSSVVFAMSAAGDHSPKYEDERFGEKKDESDKFKFARVKTGPVAPWNCIGDHCAPWSHDYPEAGLHFSKILKELSKLDVVQEENEYIFSFDDPNLFKYPFAYMCEVGYMDMSDAEIQGLREYLLRGGFLLVDDFRGAQDMSVFQYYLKRALPEAEFQMKPLDVSHPIFNCFFSIKSLELRPIYRGGYTPQFFGIEDKHGRLMMIINFNYDVSDFWQWSNDPFQPIEDTNSAYKFGVNYVFYALTH
ncbi:MAG: DUF4159 domain-containing protein [Blastocatellia bacterium]